MKFEYRVLSKILCIFVLIWLVFLTYIFLNINSNILDNNVRRSYLKQEELYLSIKKTNKSLFHISESISKLLFANGEEARSTEEVVKELGRLWSIFKGNHDFMSMNYYDEDYQLLGSWGSKINRTENYSLSLTTAKKVFSESEGSGYFTCEEVCYFHVSNPLSPSSFAEGVLIISIPVNNILYDQKTAAHSNLLFFERKDDGDVMLDNEAYFFKTATSQVDFIKIEGFLSGMTESGNPYIVSPTPGKWVFVSFFKNFNYKNYIFGFSENISDEIQGAKITFFKITIGSFLIMIAFLAMLYFVLNRMISHLKAVADVIPYISKGDFEMAGQRLKDIRSFMNKNKNEMNNLYDSMCSLNNKLRISHKNLQDKNEELKTLAEFDSLTGLYNRRKFMAVLKEMEKSIESFCFIMLDLNDFKQINDTFGHKAGDELLISFATIIKASIGEQGFYGRLGGDEFAITLFGSSKEKTDKILSTINEALSQVKLNLETISFIKVSSSMGVSTYPYDTDNLDELIAYADIAMYENKRYKKSIYHYYTGAEEPLSKW